MDTTLPDWMFLARAAKSRTYPPMSECPVCGALVDRKSSRIALHGTCPGSGRAISLDHASGRLVAALLETVASRMGLTWTISYEGLAGEPKAFRLVCDGRTVFHLPQVIGETEDEARACIAAAGRLAAG